MRVARLRRATLRAVKGFDDYMFVLRSGAGGHGVDPDRLRSARLRSAAELQLLEGWLLGCRDRRPANDDPHRRRVVVVTPLGAVGTPGGTLAAALARAGARDGCAYVLVVTAAGAP